MPLLQDEDDDSLFNPNTPEGWDMATKAHFDGRIRFPWFPKDDTGQVKMPLEAIRGDAVLSRVLPARQVPQPTFIEGGMLSASLRDDQVSLAQVEQSLSLCRDALRKPARDAFYAASYAPEPEAADVIDVNYYLALTYLTVVVEEIRQRPTANCSLPVWGEGRFSMAVDLLPSIVMDDRIIAYEDGWGAEMERHLQALAAGLSQAAIGSDALADEEIPIAVLANPFETGSVIPGTIARLTSDHTGLTAFKDLFDALEMDDF